MIRISATHVRATFNGTRRTIHLPTTRSTADLLAASRALAEADLAGRLAAGLGAGK